MDRPAFPASLPPKTLAAPVPRYMNNPSAVIASPSSPDSLGVVKIVLAFLIVGILGNVGLTIYMTRPREVVEDSPAGAKASEAMKEITQLKDDLARARQSLATTRGEINSLKTQYATIVARVGAITVPNVDAHKMDAPAESRTAEGGNK